MRRPLSPEKDHGTLLRAFRLLLDQAPNSRLLLIGWGAEEQRVEEMARQLGIDHRMHNLRHRSDVERLLSALDVTTLSGLREGLPLTLLEGMAIGMPSVATAVGEIPELLSNNCGIAVTPESAEGLAQGFLQYQRDPLSRQLDGERAREKVQARYSAATMTEENVRLYRELASPERATSPAMAPAWA